jgi:hypothetical protein
VNGFLVTVIGVPAMLFFMQVLGFRDSVGLILRILQPFMSTFEYISSPLISLQRVLWGEYIFSQDLIRILAILEVIFVFLPIIGGVVGLFVNKLHNKKNKHV